MILFLVFSVTIHLFAAAGAAMLLRRLRRGWSRTAIIALAAAPIPLLILSLSARAYVVALSEVEQKCGLDGCEEAKAFAIALAIAALVLYVIGVGGASLGTRQRKRERRADDLTDVFS